jgi:DNA-binding MarR family transcriptional regulator
MNEYLVLPDGLLTEKRPHEAAKWYCDNAGSQDDLAFEAQFLLIRAGLSAIEAGRPMHPRFSLARYNVLFRLYTAPENRLVMTDISQLLNVSMTNVTKLIDGLSQAGLVRRVEDEQDKRKTWAEMTAKGVTTFKGAFPEVAQQIEKAWAPLSAREKRVLIHLLAKFRLNLAAQPPDFALLDDQLSLEG